MNNKLQYKLAPPELVLGNSTTRNSDALDRYNSSHTALDNTIQPSEIINSAKNLFVHLRAKTDYSLLCSVNKIKNLLKKMSRR